MSDPLQIEEVLTVGENRHGYVFAVGRVEGRWAGFAVGKLRSGRKMIFFLPGTSEGYRLGLADRDEAVRRTCAIAQDPESAYGGVDVWHVGPELRAEPEAYRCKICGGVCCGGECLDAGFEAPDDDF